MNKTAGCIISVLLSVSLWGCGSNSKSSDDSSNKNITEYSNLLFIADYEGYSEVKIKNPWDSTRTLAQYLLLDSGAKVPDNLTGFTRIDVPLSNALVYSNIHCALINELGAGSGIGGVCDSEFITDSIILSGLHSGVIADCGLSSSPNIEKIMNMRPDAILLSPMGNDMGHGKLDALNIPLIETADYLERTPLGRAEWMRFYGRLFGKGAMADSLFNSIAYEYNVLKKKTSNVRMRPKVIVDGVYGQVWSVPTSGSVTGAMLKDAGVSNPFSDLSDAGSAQLSPEKVLYKGADADIWLVRYYRDADMSLQEWGAENKNYQRFKAFKDRQVYGSNTKYSGVFDDAAFHPHWILADMISVIHPELSGVPAHKSYYKKLK